METSIPLSIPFCAGVPDWTEAMCKSIRQTAFMAIALFILPSGLQAKTETVPIVSVEKKSWDVGVAVFSFDEEDLTLQSTALVLSRLVYDELLKIDIRQLSDVEKLTIVRDAITEKVRQQVEKIEKLIAARDALLFALDRDNTVRSKKDAEIVKEKRILKQLKELSPLEVDMPASLPVEFPAAKDGSEILNLNGMAADMYRRVNNLDLLISGSIVKVGEYYGIATYAWTANGRVNLWEGAGSRTEFKEIANQISLGAHGLVLGREWASLSVVTNPPEATIIVNGVPVGVGYWSDSSLHPGLHTLEVTMPGYRPEVRTTNLGSEELSQMTINLQASDVPVVPIDTEPSGANVRLGTRWLGKTPISIEVQDRIMPLTLEKEGYRIKTVPFAPDTERLIVPLVPDEGDPMEKVRLSRAKFNKAATWFAFSLAPTILFTGIRENYNNMQSVATNPADFQEANTGFSVATGAYIGSLALNGGLLTLALIRLAGFLKAVEELKE